jgi:hypothetical protein
MVPEYWESIMVCPIRPFQRCAEENDTRHLMKTFDPDYKGNFDEIYIKMTFDLIDAFGMSKRGSVLYHARRALYILELDYLITENERYVTDILLIKNKIDGLKTDENADIRKINATNYKFLRKYLEFDPNTLTVYNYHSYLKDYDKQNSKKKGNSKVRGMAS